MDDEEYRRLKQLVEQEEEERIQRIVRDYSLNNSDLTALEEEHHEYPSQIDHDYLRKEHRENLLEKASRLFVEGIKTIGILFAVIFFLGLMLLPTCDWDSPTTSSSSKWDEGATHSSSVVSGGCYGAYSKETISLAGQIAKSGDTDATLELLARGELRNIEGGTTVYVLKRTWDGLTKFRIKGEATELWTNSEFID